MSYFFVLRRFFLLGIKYTFLHKFQWISFKKMLLNYYQSLDLEINTAQIKRVHYYSQKLNILFDWMVLLRRKKLSKTEKYKRDLLVIFTPSFDDLGDEYNIKANQIMKAFKTDDIYKYPEFIVSKAIYKEFLTLDHLNYTQINKHGDEIVKWESDGKDMEFNNEISIPRLQDVIIGKGGDSIVFYRAALDTDFKKGEEEAYFKLGGLLQFSNDVFDVYKDVKNGHQTLVTVAKDINVVSDLYIQLIQEMILSFFELDLPLKHIAKFLNRVMFILSMGLGCFDQLKEVQKRNGGVFNIDHLNRQDLVFDMGKRKNIETCLQYCITYQKLIYKYRDGKKVEG